MPYIYYLPVLILVAARAIYFIVRNRNRAAALAKWYREHPEKANVGQKKDDAMEDLRNMAFSTTPEGLGLKLPSDRTMVFGVIMDFGMKAGAATILAYQTGDTSLYISTGGGILGGGLDESVSNAAQQFVNIAQKYLDRAIKTESTLLPASGNVKFYLLTNNGVYLGEDEIKNFENHSSPWTEMFDEGNKVLTELRLSRAGQEFQRANK